MLAICGAGSVPICWLYVVLGAHLCVGYMYCGVLSAHLVQEGSGPCKIPNFSHLLCSYGTYIYFVRQVLSLARDKVKCELNVDITHTF